jgi:hypothetical protein
MTSDLQKQNYGIYSQEAVKSAAGSLKIFSRWGRRGDKHNSL